MLSGQCELLITETAGRYAVSVIINYGFPIDLLFAISN